MKDPRRKAPAVERNREPILAVLRRVLPQRGRLLELAAGSGEHCVFFAPVFPEIDWVPTDGDPDAMASIAAWQEAEPSPNLRAPTVLDVAQRPWPFRDLDAVLAINLVHISPWSTTEALFAEAAAALKREGVLVLYGPYRIGGGHTAPSNEVFDDWLRKRDPSWGVRDLEAVAALAARSGFGDCDRVPMPANNQVLVFERA